MNARVLMLAIALVAGACSGSTAQAQAPQDSTLDNLAHDAGYVTAAPGKLGAVVERGKGPIDMVLVSGFGLGASAFESFMRRNEARYHMLAVTLPGFEGTAAPPMPPAGTSYGEQTWTRAAVEAVAALIRERKLKRPVLVGHYLNGTQVATEVAARHPDLSRALILLAGTALYEPTRPSRFWPRGLTVEKRTAMVDQFLAPRWFKTVTRQTWVRGNFVATDFSVDSTLGRTFADRANAPPLPVLIRYLCEFHASDVRPSLSKSNQPLLLIEPTFTPALRADTTRAYLGSYFSEGWKGVFDERRRTQAMALDQSGILVMEDHAAEVDQAIAEFLKRHAR
ncbi:MAG TPA: alpha/beta hydrolase [Candidatus Eisenbacteria bacterium]|nr:alpha/beta hydrolase [Candidatus Eisenbacteria bacterium]